MRTTELSIKKRIVRPRQHLPPGSLGQQQRTGAVHRTLTLHGSWVQFLMATSEKRTPGDSQRARRRDIAQDTKVPHDGPAEVPSRSDAGGHKGVTEVQMARMRPALVPVRQSGSSSARLGGGGNVGRAARMDHGDIQQCATVGQGNGHFSAGLCPPDGQQLQRQRQHNWVYCTHYSPHGDVAESFLPVFMSTRAAATQAIATHGVVYIAALDVTPTKTSGGRDMRIGASSANS
jgi:hypothetical protein